jgi:hypothetical protein
MPTSSDDVSPPSEITTTPASFCPRYRSARAVSPLRELGLGERFPKRQQLGLEVCIELRLQASGDVARAINPGCIAVDETHAP